MSQKVTSRPPTRPNIPRPSSFRSGSNAGYSPSRRSTNSTKITKFEQYLYPQNLSSAAPLATNVYPIESPCEAEEEEDIEPTSIYEKFDRQRKKILSKYINPPDSNFIEVSLKSDRLKISKPTFHKNESCLLFSEPTRTENSYSLQDEELGEEIGIEFDLNDIWFDSILLELDDVYPEFLDNLQNDSEDQDQARKNNDNSSVKSDSSDSSIKKLDDESYLMSEDPIQLAFSVALKKQRAKATYDEEEEALKAQQIFHRTLSAAEINRQWGFKDPAIGKYIAKFRKQFEDGKKKMF